MDFNDMTPRHGEVEYWQEKCIDLQAENKRLREALNTIYDKWLWWREDEYDRCITVPEDAIYYGKSLTADGESDIVVDEFADKS